MRTGNISPQFHVVYDDYFETVHTSPDKDPEVWPELIVFQSLGLILKRIIKTTVMS